MENIIDREEVMERVDGDLELLMEMVELFCHDYPKLLSQMRDAIENKDDEALEHSAHTLKGTVGNFSAIGAYETAFRLEKMAREGDITNASEVYITLAGEIERLEPVLIALGTEDV